MEIILEVEDLVKWFPIKRGIFGAFGGKKQYVRAVDGISFNAREGEMLGLVGESGCGKTTTGKIILRLIEPTCGKAYFKRRDIFSFDAKNTKDFRRSAQIIFQNPYSCLNPRMSVYSLLSEPLEFHGIASSKAERREMVIEALKTVQLVPPEIFIDKTPRLLSGGQRQRVAITRALMTKPVFIVADEPVSMLDVSIRANILNLLLDLKKRFNLSGLFITHDLAVARYMCERISVMYLGKIVEVGPTEEIVNKPRHPYTQALLSVVPVPDALKKPHRKVEQVIRGTVPDATSPPPGCRFHPRCLNARGICKQDEPELREIAPSHQVACHFA